MATSSVASLTSSNTSLTPLESEIRATTSTTAANRNPTQASAVPAAALTQSTTTDSEDALAQDLVQLFKTLVSGDVDGAKNDLARFQQDLNAQSNRAAAASTTVSTNETANDPTQVSYEAQKPEQAQTQQNINSQAATGARTVPPSIVTPSSSLDALAGKLSQSLTTGSTSTALQDLATFLIQSGRGSGNLVNVNA
jgi:septal ring factor EnvC (AmiA/AmiB activator)